MTVYFTLRNIVHHVPYQILITDTNLGHTLVPWYFGTYPSKGWIFFFILQNLMSYFSNTGPDHQRVQQTVAHRSIQAHAQGDKITIYDLLLIYCPFLFPLQTSCFSCSLCQRNNTFAGKTDITSYMVWEPIWKCEPLLSLLEILVNTLKGSKWKA